MDALGRGPTMTIQNKGRNSRDELLKMTTDVVSAYLGNNAVGSHEISSVINTVYKSLDSLNKGLANGDMSRPKLSIPTKKTVTPDYLVCLEDGKKLKMLKRHLRTNYGMTPEEYRAKWGLPADYPMVAPNYAAQRSAFAKKIGLGKAHRPNG